MNNTTQADGVRAVQQFIAENGVDALTEQFGITVKKYDNGYCKLNYDQIVTPKFHHLADFCRGLILHVRPDNTSSIAARSFPRFYNLGEGNTKTFDFSDCTAFEKADGSLVMLWYSALDHKWIISTRGMVYAEGNFSFSLTASGGTFHNWILKAFGVSDEQLQVSMGTFSRDFTYVLEYTAPENRIVTPYHEAKMILLTVLNNETGAELTDLPQIAAIFAANGMNVRPPNTFPVESSAQLIELVSNLPDLQEGVVVVNNKTRERVKIKNAVYVNVHHLRGEGTPSRGRLMELVLIGETEEVLTYFPEFDQYIKPIERARDQLLEDAAGVYATYTHLETQKEFALAVKDTRVAPILFKARTTGKSPAAVFAELEVNTASKILEKYIDVTEG